MKKLAFFISMVMVLCLSFAFATENDMLISPNPNAEGDQNNFEEPSTDLPVEDGYDTEIDPNASVPSNPDDTPDEPDSTAAPTPDVTPSEAGNSSNRIIGAVIAIVIIVVVVALAALIQKK